MKVYSQREKDASKMSVNLFHWKHQPRHLNAIRTNTLLYPLLKMCAMRTVAEASIQIHISLQKKVKKIRLNFNDEER